MTVEATDKEGSVEVKITSMMTSKELEDESNKEDKKDDPLASVPVDNEVSSEASEDLKKEAEDLKKEVPTHDPTTRSFPTNAERGMIEDGALTVLDVPMREFNMGPISFNPFTSMIGIIALWGLAIWCMVNPEQALENLLETRANVGLYFTWFIIITKPLAFFWVLYIAYKFGDVKFGERDEEPEFNGMQFFSMIFAAGVAVGIFYYGVAEPLWHQDSHWYANAGYRSQDEIDQMAMTYTLFHWGFMAWAVYILVAVTTALAAYRFKLPLTFRSCFYPILGEYTWGWLGDVIDGFSIVTTVSGVCTSLGLGAIQITAGFQRLGWADKELTTDELVLIQTILIICITAVATASVISGLSIGIKYLSMFAFGLGMVLTFIVLTLENTHFILNLQVQSIGHFLQWTTFQMNFQTDAFGQLREGEGRAVDGNAAAAWWMEAWTVFYWNWWTSWACFVGLFVARISRGRTVGELIIYSLVAPFLYCLFWFCIWGGAGLRQSRQALEMQELGQEHFNDTSYFQHGVSDYCYDVPQEDLWLNGTLIFTNYLKGITPVCVFESTDASSFNVLYSFSYPSSFPNGGMGSVLTVLYLFAVAVYFCTSSDSGSLVVDFLASNGKHEHHWLQRLFWALTEGAVAIALLNAGGRDGLAAVQAASIIAGLPFTLFLVFLMQTMYEFCEQAVDDNNKFYEPHLRKEFRMPVYGGIFNVMELAASLGGVHHERVAMGIDRPQGVHVVEFFKGLFLPFVSLLEIVTTFYSDPSQKISNLLTVGIYTFLHFGWIVLFCATSAYPALRAWGWVCFFMNGCLLTSIKTHYRTTNSLHGNIVGDFFTSLFFFPQVFAQLIIEVRANDFISGAPQETEGLIDGAEEISPADDSPEPTVPAEDKTNTSNVNVALGPEISA
ncbi:Glycine betaine/proline/choline [Seminavis robusta]|uniref:Glycine betaine/proline/choline n=1 Tax=Seminavis robusta TaxID=568900 RepID=A0A9N8DN43_9STRA|nr:Glycine betaine/proline/choline [Seminavis robusta]|eukprot:Sro252_g099660.1 Glycine betaine/proline/choline (897) ;mRNA; r:46171-49611